MEILYLILNIAAVILLSILLINIFKTFIQKKHSKKRKRNTLLVLIFFTVIVSAPLYFSKVYIKDLNLNTTEKRINHYSKYQKYLTLNNIYFDSLLSDSNNIDLHYNYVYTLEQQINKNSKHSQYNPSGINGGFYSNRLLEYYNYYIQDTIEIRKNIGHLFSAQHYIDLRNTTEAIEHLNLVTDTTLKYYNYLKGKAFAKTYYSFNYAEAEYYLKQGLKDSIQQAVDELAGLYFYFRKNEKLKELVYNNKKNPALNSFFKRITYMRSTQYLSYWETVFKNRFSNISFWGTISALAILCIWLFYLVSIDIYEAEKWYHILFTLLMSMTTIFLVFPLSDTLLDVIEYSPAGGPVYSFFHITISVGMVEEFVKILPVIILLRFTNAINEPFDYILYASISALGFAFIENLSYIQDHSLYNINARALTASVSHIIDSSTIGYGLMLAKYKYKSHSFIIFLAFFFLASLMHGFYDFWLLEDSVQSYEWITLVFYIFSIHIWHIYANNTLNISTFFHPNIEIQNDKIRVYLIFALVSLLMFSYLINGYTRGKMFGDQYLLNSIIYYGYFILYLAISLSNFKIIRGYLSPFGAPLLLFIPKLKRVTNFSGLHIKIAPSKRHEFRPKYAELRPKFFSNGTLQQRIVVDNNLEAYVTALHQTINFGDYINDLVIIFPHSKKKSFNDDSNILIHVYLIPNYELLEQPILKKDDFEYLGWAISKKI
ncbi:MAG: PrsW family intramembrane metalloprotease [Flavobacteriales bacterium]|jgi:RsiW-degrading membrane proteinase PrsW (M82 family)|nr:PrsW family intramembrane metalloprotease [Flavobacteriales bacterium]